MRFADAVRASVLLRKQEQRATVDELLGSELDETIGPEHITEFAAVLVAIAFAAALGSRTPTANKTKQKIRNSKQMGVARLPTEQQTGHAN